MTKAPKKPTKPTTSLKVKLTDKKKRTSSSRQWLLRQLNDPYVAKAKEEGYRSRAAFKLVEINQKFKILKPGFCVIDLGAAPGGWSQVAVELVKADSPKGGKVIAVDISEMAPIPNVTILHADFTAEETPSLIKSHLQGDADVVLSDMAAPACGMTDIDHMRIMMLVEEAYNFAIEVLKPGGAFVAKVLRGGTETKLLGKIKSSFTKVQHFKPPSSRQDSAEMYVVALGFKKDTL
jgi:23S rRNA (uridine2552-2'-O)-methyltransferase